MLKRTTKVTSLLIIATSIVSIVPAMATEVKKVDAEEGTVYQADAKGDGLFYIGGKINGEEASYYVADNKYTKVDGIESSDTVGKTYENKYLEFNDGDYYLDYTTGKMTGENIGDNVIDDAATAVRKNIKNDNDGRFADSATDKLISANIKRYGAGDREIFFDGPFGNWTHYSYTLKKDTTKTTTIYADAEGKYVDGDYSLGDLKVYIGAGLVTGVTTGGSVTIKNTEDTYTVGGYELKAEIQENSVLTEGYADLYRKADLTIYARKKGTTDTFTPVTNKVVFGGENGHVATSVTNDAVTVVEQFSKEQASDDIDGIKYPKNTKIYFITDDKGKYEPALGLGDASSISGASYGYGVFTTSAKCITSAFVDLGKSKIYSETLNLKSKNGYNYVDLSDSDTTDIENTGAWAIGGGDLYCLSDGYVKTWDGNESFEKIYKVDGAMKNIKASDKNNIVVWSDEGNDDNNVYSVISSKAAATDKAATTDATTSTSATTTASVTIAKTGWTKSTDGTWSFVKVDGTKAIAWLQDGTTWYYLNAAGVMQTGWINDNGTWYYCNGSGAMLANTTVDGYLLGASGAWAK